MISDNKVREIAERYIGEQKSCFKYEFVGIFRSPRFSGEVNVNFSVTSPECKVYEGPVIVIVNEASGLARLFE